MDKPKCRLCGDRHLGECPSLKQEPGVVTKPVASVTKPVSVTKPKGGRPRTHASNADRQRAYRERNANR